jgi:PmbA protein
MNSQQLINNVDFSNPYDLIQDISDELLKLCKGFEVQLNAKLLQEGTSRFANNQITQHTDLETLTLYLKLSKGKRIASSFTTTLTKENLSKFVKETIKSLESSPEISFYQGLPDPVKGSTIDSSGFAWTPEDRVNAINESVRTGQSIDQKINLSGTASEQKTYKRIISSNGVDVEDSFQINYFKINSISGSPDKRGYGQEGIYWRYSEPEYTEMTKNTVDTAMKTIKFIDLPAPKDYEVVLDHSAVSNLVNYVLYSINPVDFHEGSSFTSDRIGDQIFDKKFSIENLPKDPKKAIFTGSFDNEGIATRNTSLIENGVLKHIPYNSFFASKFLQDKNLTTGSDLYPVDYFDTPIPTSAVMKTGNKSLEDQISDVSDGLFVKTFWYNRFTIKKEGGLTGLTRNGLFHIKNGEIKEAVRNLRYTESFLKALGSNNIVSMGNICKSDNIINSVPSMHLENYHFSSVAHSFE